MSGQQGAFSVCANRVVHVFIENFPSSYMRNRSLDRPPPAVGRGVCEISRSIFCFLSELCDRSHAPHQNPREWAGTDYCRSLFAAARLLTMRWRLVMTSYVSSVSDKHDE